jgi:hypothetical protein
MTMPPYPVVCRSPGCGLLARYKIAARWTDGITAELKTYALCCEQCLPDLFARSRQKQAACRLTPGEELDPPSIYLLEPGRRDAQLQRLEDLEREHAGEPGA